MSLRIQIEKVIGVQVGNAWHDVVPGTFDIDSYEFIDDGELVHGGGRYGVCASGFTFVIRERNGDRSNQRIAGPLTAIQAVRYVDERQP